MDACQNQCNIGIYLISGNFVNNMLSYVLYLLNNEFIQFDFKLVQKKSIIFQIFCLLLSFAISFISLNNSLAGLKLVSLIFCYF